MSDRIEYDEATGEMEPTLPEPIAKALAYLLAMSEPYFNGAILDDAEHQLRLAIVQHTNPHLVAAVRAFRQEWDDAPPGTDWPAAGKLRSWRALVDEMGYDRDIERALSPGDAAE